MTQDSASVKNTANYPFFLTCAGRHGRILQPGETVLVDKDRIQKTIRYMLESWARNNVHEPLPLLVTYEDYV